MARAMQGVLDAPSGSLGPSVWCHGPKRNAYVRALPLSHKDRKSAAQLENRAKMKTTMAFLSRAKDFVNHNMDHLTKNESATNRAMKMNFHQVEIGVRSMEGKRGVRQVPDYHQSTPVYERLRLSEGERFELDAVMALMEGSELELAWNVFLHAGVSEAEDKVNVLVYDATRHTSLTKLNVAERRDGSVRIGLPDRWSGDELHVYVSVSDRAEEVFSNSVHVGLNCTKSGAEDGEREESNKSAITEQSYSDHIAVEMGESVTDVRGNAGVVEGKFSADVGGKGETVG